MIELKNWISGICAVSLLISIIKSILPASAAGKTFNLTASLILIIAVIAPIKTIGFDEFDLETERNKEAIDEMVQRVTDENAKLTDGIIESELSEYICNKTDLSEDNIKITCKNGEVVKVQLNIKDENALKVIKNECGIPEERIESW